LSTVYGIVEQSGGHISVSSEPGSGSVFRLFFPRVEAVAPPVRAQTVAASHPGTETILLVEDERALRGLGRRILAAAGYRVLEAESGQDAIALLAAHDGPVHLLLTDVVMPGMNGRELADRVKAERPELRVLYTSGHTNDAIFRHGVLDDPRHFLAKPYRPAQLKAKVRELLDE
jgi:CheY-like chemotaxis protein